MEDPEAVVDWALQAAANDSDEVEGEVIVLHDDMTRAATRGDGAHQQMTRAVTAPGGAPRVSPRTQALRSSPINAMVEDAELASSFSR